MRVIRWGMLRSILEPEMVSALPGGNVVLTFDDGPNPYRDTSSRLLGVLREAEVRAIFCPVGRYAVQEPELVRQLVGEGHLVANHTFEHRLLPLCGRRKLREEIERGAELLSCLAGDSLQPLFRPPFGIYDGRVEAYCRQAGLRMCSLTAFHFDTLYRPARWDLLIRRILRDLKRSNGGVIVLHERICVDGVFRKERVRPDGLLDRSWVPDAVRELVRGLRAKGFSFDPEPYLRLREAGKGMGPTHSGDSPVHTGS